MYTDEGSTGAGQRFAYSDEQIDAALAPLRPITYETVPIEGRWCTPPFEQRVLAGRTVAVLCEDPDISMVVLDRSSGEVLLVDPEQAAEPVNASLAQLVACAHAYRAAAGEVALHRHDDSALTAAAHRVLALFAAIDPSAVRHASQLWSVAAEVLSYGL